MDDKKGNLNTSGMGELSKAYTTGALEALMTHNKKTKAAANRSEEKSEKLPTVKPSRVDPHAEKLGHIKNLLNECYGCQYKEVYGYRINGALCYVEYPEDMIEQFEIPEEALADLEYMGDEYTGKDLIIQRLELDEIEQALQEEIVSQKQLIKDMFRDLYGIKLRDVYAYKVNDVLSLDESLEAMADRLGVPQEMRADLKDVGSQCNGTTSAGEEITIGRVGLEEAIGELTEQIFPSIWDGIKELENELSGISIQSEDVYTYKVNNLLRVVESPEVLAQSLGLPEAKQSALRHINGEYHGRDIRGKAITVKHVGLYDALEQLGEQILSQRQLIKELAMKFYGTELKEVYPYHINGEFVVAESPEALASRLGLPQEELVEMRVGDTSEYGDETSEDEPNEIERISLNEAVEDLRAKLSATRNHSGKELAQ